MHNAKATVVWGEGQITFEGTEGFVRAEVTRYTNAASKSTIVIPVTPEYISVSPADFVAQKKPKGHHELVAVLAFAMAEQGNVEFTEDDMKRVYLQARVRPPKVVAQALRDAKNKFDYLENGGKRGSYKLSHHGDRTVRYDLPRP